MVVANRLPLDDSAAPDGACEWRRSPGGLAGALRAILEQTPATWVGWPGYVGSTPTPPDIGTLRIHPVPLAQDELSGYYEGFANSTLWPLYHDAVEQPVFDRGWWEAYRDVNRRFAEAAGPADPRRRGLLEDRVQGAGQAAGAAPPLAGTVRGGVVVQGQTVGHDHQGTLPHHDRLRHRYAADHRRWWIRRAPRRRRSRRHRRTAAATPA